MNLFEEIFLNIIIILFPILIYFIYICCIISKKTKKNDILLCFTLFTSTYLFLKYQTSVESKIILLFCNIPIIIGYLKQRSKLSIILSIFVILYSYTSFDNNILPLTIKFVIYYLIFKITTKKKVKDNETLSIYAVIQGFFLSFEYFFNNNIENIALLLQLFLITFIFYAITFIVLYLLNTIDKVTNTFSQMKKLQKEHEIKESLFKLTHEIKNPLAVCKGYLDMLDVNDSKKVNKYIPIIKQEINRSLNIMSDFLEYSKIRIEKEIIDINVLLDDVYDSFKLLNKARNIKIEYNEQEKEIYINGDYSRLKQVLLNLLKNSSEAIENKGIIIIDREIMNNKCVISIEDNGIGMTEETLSQITKLFYTTKKEGSGIGVSLSNEIIKAHNGNLIYTSTINKGTIAKIELPLKKDFSK